MPSLEDALDVKGSGKARDREAGGAFGTAGGKARPGKRLCPDPARERPAFSCPGARAAACASLRRRRGGHRASPPESPPERKYPGKQLRDLREDGPSSWEEQRHGPGPAPAPVEAESPVCTGHAVLETRSHASARHRPPPPRQAWVLGRAEEEDCRPPPGVFPGGAAVPASHAAQERTPRLCLILLNFSLDCPDSFQQGTSLLRWSPDLCEHRRGSTRWVALGWKVTPVSTVCSGSRIGMASRVLIPWPSSPSAAL
ncbi:uncharacterized protein LOC132211339 [Myotis daubentonii]|uniref:uncharacterized protein LOC132211339 n=1 Tax=Myotis daubentonii TaxID=98922 RepID=UPI002872BEE1|nr:uncharacterized protein LOC132211339 [Myotis daubentonii]